MKNITVNLKITTARQTCKSFKRAYPTITMHPNNNEYY